MFQNEMFEMLANFYLKHGANISRHCESDFVKVEAP